MTGHGYRTGLRSNPTRDIFREVNTAALPRLASLCAAWLPGGRRRGTEYLALNPTRDDKRIGSFSINLTTGRWGDFATDHRGGDPISLCAYLRGITQIEAARALADELGVQA